MDASVEVVASASGEIIAVFVMSGDIVFRVTQETLANILGDAWTEIVDGTEAWVEIADGTDAWATQAEGSETWQTVSSGGETWGNVLEGTESWRPQ
jgi:hypothetical protein